MADYMRAPELKEFVKKVHRLEDEGLLAKQVAARLGVSVHTLRYRVRRYYDAAPPIDSCAEHISKEEALPYNDWHERAQQEALKGHRQRRCKECNHVFYSWEMKTKPKAR